MIQTETLNLLEWPRLCQQWATFAATKLGALAARHGRIPTHQSKSEQLLAQTCEVYQLEDSHPLNFRGIQDMGDSLERSRIQGILSGDELLDIATTLAGARQLRRTIDAQEEEDFPVLQGLVAQLRTYPELEKEIHHCIDDRGKVTDRANPKLAGIRKSLRTTHDQLHAKLQRIMQRNSGAVQETLITQRAGRFVIPVKAPQKDAIPGIVHDVSTSGATFYIEPQGIVSFGNSLRQLERQETREEELVRQRLTEQIAEVSDDLEQLMAIVTTLDLATARARYSLWLEANPPRFSESHERTVLRQLRHPILVWQQRHEEGTTVVPIDVTMRPDIRVVAITGPNTGGKTVTLKTLGLAALMAKVGLFIPAREPVELPWFDQVLADIGDEQSIEQSLSTFSGHIRRIGRILEAIGAGAGAEVSDSNGGSAMDQGHPTNSLVLLDEVGAGTDPTEGSALAIALLQHLANHTRLTVATTHFGELKALKYQDDRFENASVEFDDVSLSPTYRLLWGIPGRSNALTIARRLGLNPTVLDTAQTYVGVSKQDDVNQVIAGLEAQRKRQETQAEEAANIVAQAEALKTDIERRAAAIKDWERSQKLEQEKAIQAAVVEAKAEIATVIRQLQKGTPTAQAAQKATAVVEDIAQQQQLPTGSHPAKKVVTDYKPKLGEKVRLLGLGGQTAEVVSEPDGDGKIAVRFGLMKTTVDLKEIESLTGQKVAIEKKTSEKTPEKRRPTVQVVKKAPSAPAIRTETSTLDLRGMRVADAEIDLENFIANATGPIWIIHGHGTGKLKRGVREFLKRHPQVRSFEAAEQADGGTGVTVVQV